MVKFLGNKEEHSFRRFVYDELTYKYNQVIQVNNDEIVTGITGNENIEEALIVRFYPSDAKVEWVEDKISADIHRYCYEHKLNLVRSPVIEKTAWNGEIRYGLVYTKGGF